MQWSGKLLGGLLSWHDVETRQDPFEIYHGPCLDLVMRHGQLIATQIGSRITGLRRVLYRHLDAICFEVDESSRDQSHHTGTT